MNGCYLDGLLTLDKFNSHFCWLWARQKIGSVWMTASDLKYLQNSFKRNKMLRQSLFFTYWLPKHPVFWFTPFSQHSRLSCLWLPTTDCGAPVWLSGLYATPLVTRCFPVQPSTSSLTLPWAITRFKDSFYTFSPAHRSDSQLCPNPNPCLQSHA